MIRRSKNLVRQSFPPLLSSNTSIVQDLLSSTNTALHRSIRSELESLTLRCRGRHGPGEGSPGLIRVSASALNNSPSSVRAIEIHHHTFAVIPIRSWFTVIVSAIVLHLTIPIAISVGGAAGAAAIIVVSITITISVTTVAIAASVILARRVVPAAGRWRAARSTRRSALTTASIATSFVAPGSGGRCAGPLPKILAGVRA
jgi:hypothetical protein